MQSNKDGQWYTFLKRYWYRDCAVTNNLCNAAWATVWVSALLILGGVLAGSLLWGWVHSILLLFGIPFPSYYVGGMAGVAWGIIIIAGSVLAAVLYDEHQDKIPKLRDSTAYDVVTSYIKAKKEGYCPRIEWKDD